MSEHNSDSLDSFERELSRLAPTKPNIDRDRLMFLAGQASTQYSVLSTKYSGRNWLWPAATLASTATSLALAIALALRPTSPPTIVFRDAPLPAPATPADQPDDRPANRASLVARSDDSNTSPPSSSYLKTREVALRMGLDALGSPAYSAEPAGPSTYRDLWLGMTTVQRLSESAGGQSEKQTTM